MKRHELNYFSIYLLAREALSRGITVSKVLPDTKKSYLKLKYKNKTQVIIGQRIMAMAYNACFICNNKEVTRDFLKEAGLDVVDGKRFFKDQIDKAYEYAKDIDYPVVVKPVKGTWGKDVYLNLKNKKEVQMAIIKVLKNKEEFLVEKQFIGEEYRILATRDKLLGVINRIPANVVGDGKHTIEELIEVKNSDPRRGEGHSKALVKIKIDEELVNHLKKKNLHLNSIPKEGEQLLLRDNSNLSTGGDSVDITDKVHPKLKTLAPKVVRAIPGLPYAGFDFMTKDITQDPDKVGYAVIEINDSPMLSMHHEPFKGKKRNVAKEIIDLAFPETCK